MTTTDTGFGVTFTKKPIPVQALHYIGPDSKLVEHPWDANAERLQRHGAPVVPTEHWAGECGEEECKHNYDLYCGTLEDGQEGSAQVQHIASVGDWIICGIENEFYPCKDSIFRSTYDFPPA
jgi:hypothetical protein